MSIDVSILKYNMRAHKYNLTLLIDKTLLVLFFLVILINIVSLFSRQKDEMSCRRVKFPAEKKKIRNSLDS